jgi:hypothetical protein
MAIADSDVLQWAAVASAAFAAVAALASWAAVWQAREISLSTQLPKLHIVVSENIDTGEIRVHIANDIGGLARDVAFAVVAGGQSCFGSLPPTAMLQPGDSATLVTPLRTSSREIPAIVSCRDSLGRLHVWAVDGKHRVWPRRRWLVRLPLGQPKGGDWVFQKFFPDAAAPSALPFLCYERIA